VRGGFVALLAVGILLYLIHVFVAPLGYFAVREACTSKGGLQILKSDVVDGYFNDGLSIEGMPDRVDCWLCASQVADHEFAYVDFERTEAMNAGEPGVYRFELGPALADRGNCVGGQFVHVPAGQCVTARRLDGPTSARYEYRREWVTRKGLLGVEIRERSQAVYELASGNPVASHRYFDYATPAERRGKFARSYHCENSPIDPDDTKAFFRRVLRSHITDNDNPGATP
jgi:hypothetical protein